MVLKKKPHGLFFHLFAIKVIVLAFLVHKSNEFQCITVNQ